MYTEEWGAPNIQGYGKERFQDKILASFDGEFIFASLGPNIFHLREPKCLSKIQRLRFEKFMVFFPEGNH